VRVVNGGKRGRDPTVTDLKPAAKVGVWSGAAIFVLFFGAWIPMRALGASRHQQGAVLLSIFGVVVVVGVVAAVRTGLRVRREREQGQPGDL